MSRLQSHKRRLESGELEGPENKRKRKRLMIKISSIKKQLAVGGNDAAEVTTKKVISQVQTTSTDNDPKNSQGTRHERKKTSRKKLKKKTMHLNKELKDLAQRKQLKRAMSVFSKGERKGLVDVHSYTNMINAFIRCSKLNLALELYRQMKQHKLKPNVVTYTILIKGAFNSYDIGMAKRLFGEMAASNVKANVRMHNAYFRGCIQTGAIDEAVVHFRKMECMPDVTTYESVVSLLCKGLKMDEALGVVSAIDPISKENPAIYFALARAYALKNSWSSFEHYVRLFQEKLKHNDMLARQIALRRQNDPNEKEKEEHYLERVRSIRQFAEHRQEEFLLHSIEFQSLINERKALASPNDTNFDLNLYLSKVLVIDRKNISGVEDKMAARVDYALSKLQKSFGLVNTENNIETVKFLLQKRFDAKGQLLNSKASSAAVKIDICSGSGEWALAQAKNDPQSLWITLEVKSDRVYDTFWGMTMGRLDNMMVLQADAQIAVGSCIPKQFVDEVYINHPEPPERTGGTDDSDGEHLLTQVFFQKLSQTLKPDGRIVIVTDNKNYGESLRKILARSGFADFYANEHERRAQQGYIPDALDNMPMSATGVTLHEGVPKGHNNNSSTRFDRLWAKGEKNRRFFICVSKSLTTNGGTLKASQDE